MDIEVNIPEPFKELFIPSKPWRHLVYYGGRASGKSTEAALSRVISGSRRKERGLCCREYQNSIADSSHKLLADLISSYHFNDWEVTKDTIRNKKTRSEIIFKGLHNNAQSIKSTEGLNWAWIEEAQTISAESIETLVPTIREPNSYLIWTFNPLTDHDPVWDKIVKTADERTYVHKVNSHEIEELLPEVMIHEREKMKEENPELYSHIWLGEPLTSKTGSVFGRQLAQAEIDGRITNVPYDSSVGVFTAWDLGIGDSTVIWFFQLVGREIHFIDHYESSGEDLGYYINYLRNKPYNYAQHFLPHDANHRGYESGKTRVEFFNDNGIHNVEVLRPTKFQLGQDDINLIARPKFSLCWFDRDKCARGIECLRAYHYEYDIKNKLLKDKPEHDWSSHSSSAFIYALMAYTENAQYFGGNRTKLKTYTPKEFRQNDSSLI